MMHDRHGQNKGGHCNRLAHDMDNRPMTKILIFTDILITRFYGYRDISMDILIQNIN